MKRNFILSVGVLVLLGLAVWLLGGELQYLFPPQRIVLEMVEFSTETHPDVTLRGSMPQLLNLTHRAEETNEMLADRANRVLQEYQDLMEEHGAALAEQNARMILDYHCEILTDTQEYFCFRTVDYITLEGVVDETLRGLQRERYVYYSYVQAPGRRKGETRIDSLQRLLKDSEEEYTSLLQEEVLRQIEALPRNRRSAFHLGEDDRFIGRQQLFYIDVQGSLVLVFPRGAIAEERIGLQEFVIPDGVIRDIRVL